MNADNATSTLKTGNPWQTGEKKEGEEEKKKATL